MKHHIISKYPLPVVGCLLLPTPLLTSCFKEEPLNSECDIEQAYLHVANSDILFGKENDTINVNSTEDRITFQVKRHTDLSHMAPSFKITEGASITPANGSTQDFSKGELTYTVTSQDGNFQRHYLVGFAYPPIAYEEMKFGFDTFFLNENKPVHKYYVWSDKNDDGSLANNWATGNPGFNMSNGSAKPEDYPTVPVEDAIKGHAVKLTTRDTGAFGAMVNMPLAAGNLFLGKFDASQALLDAMKATQFGTPVSFKPLSINGYYKYKRGEVFTDREKKEVKDRKDYATIYAVLYDNHDAQGNSIVLYGDNVQTSTQVVAIAKLAEIDDTPEWTRFDLNFEYLQEVDEEKLQNMGYSMTIVASSSVEGARFMGAIGSTLWVDEISVVCENIHGK